MITNDAFVAISTHPSEGSSFTKSACTNQLSKDQNFTGTLAVESFQVCKIVDQQYMRPVIRCDGEKLKTVFRFKYLVTIFTSDANQQLDIKTRIVKSFSRCGDL